MFTFIKKVQELLSKLKKNKGLWFTMLSVASTTGIFVFMYMIMTMTGTVSEKVYNSMSDDYNLNINAKIDNKQEQFKKLSVTLQENTLLKTAIETNNIVLMDKMKNNINENFLKNGFNSLSINLFSIADKQKVFRNTIITSVSSKRILYGTEVLKEGVFFIYLVPLKKNGVVYGVLEIKESIHSLKNTLTKENKQYIFLLDKKMLASISLEKKADNYQEVSSEYTLNKKEYETKFATSISDLNDEMFKQLLSDGYLIDFEYFRTINKVTDINGVDIGLIVTGENIDTSGSFVNIAVDMTNSITTVALGLVISIILFLF